MGVDKEEAAGEGDEEEDREEVVVEAVDEGRTWEGGKGEVEGGDVEEAARREEEGVREEEGRAEARREAVCWLESCGVGAERSG